MRGAGERYLIVNADDFGLTSGINRGVIEAHEHGIVTSASLMVRYPTAHDAAAYARAHRRLSVGLHFEAAEWRYRDGEWYAAYEVVRTDDARQIRAELDRQLAAFTQLLGRDPTHLDSHQHVHQSEPARSIMVESAERLNVPLRSCTSAIAYNGSFYGQTGEGEPFPDGISLTQLREMITTLPPGWTEFGCHVGYAEDLDSVYAAEREEELRVLCAKALRGVLDANCVHLCSFHDFNSATVSRRNN
jgi:predicted glycoside hydrolase/deacetylase ChbG (UPF0249 family)